VGDGAVVWPLSTVISRAFDNPHVNRRPLRDGTDILKQEGPAIRPSQKGRCRRSRHRGGDASIEGLGDRDVPQRVRTDER